jgi:hypothetical protein
MGEEVSIEGQGGSMNKDGMKDSYSKARKSMGYDGGKMNKGDAGMKPEKKKFGKRKATKS